MRVIISPFPVSFLPNRLIASRRFLIAVVLCCGFITQFVHSAAYGQVPKAEDLWLSYDELADHSQKEAYQTVIGEIHVTGNSDMMNAVQQELESGIRGLLGRTRDSAVGYANLVVGTPESSEIILNLEWANDIEDVGDEGFIIRQTEYNDKPLIIIASAGEAGLLYGAFHFLRLLQTDQPIDRLDISETPRIAHRMLNHWDNILPTRLGPVERGYVGHSIWIWDDLPNRRSAHYRDYARAMASLGLNGVALNNVNADPKILTTEYLEKVAALAEEFRPYGIKVFLSASFAAPLRASERPRFKAWGGIGDLDTADPLDPQVQEWWNDKADEIYGLIPDFGGFLVKADSEGMHGPQAYGQTHADGANMLADALSPHGGILIWRAFVYDGRYSDRIKAAYGEFKPFDGQFNENVVVQVKNGPLDFQPREPVNPLFGAMPETPLSLELQITQEYLGHNIHLVYLAPMWKEVLDFDTHHQGPGSTVARVVDGSLHDNHNRSVIAGVANIGIGPKPVNWTGHPFGQANWYAFGRLAWNPDLDSREIAKEWIRMTWPLDQEAEDTILDMMMGSWNAAVDYKTPLGLSITVDGAHYDPAPHIRERHFFTSNEMGIGYDRTSSGSNAVNQYHPAIAEKFDDITTVPESYLLWFHFVPWDHQMQSGLTLWDELVARYNDGVTYVEDMLSRWDEIESKMDPAKHAHVRWLLIEQLDHARTYRDVCLQYFSERSGRSLN